MSEFEDLPDHDERSRAYSDKVYFISTFRGNRIVCSRPGMTLIDFYRTTDVLAKDVKPPENMKSGQV